MTPEEREKESKRVAEFDRLSHEEKKLRKVLDGLEGNLQWLCFNLETFDVRYLSIEPDVDGEKQRRTNNAAINNATNSICCLPSQEVRERFIEDLRDWIKEYVHEQVSCIAEQLSEL